MSSSPEETGWVRGGRAANSWRSTDEGQALDAKDLTRQRRNKWTTNANVTIMQSPSLLSRRGREGTSGSGSLECQTESHLKFTHRGGSGGGSSKKSKLTKLSSLVLKQGFGTSGKSPYHQNGILAQRSWRREAGGMLLLEDIQQLQ